jgi:hypothetical protein
MAHYGVIFEQPVNLPKAITEVRAYSKESIGEIKQRLSTGQVAFYFDGDEYELDSSLSERQKEILNAFAQIELHGHKIMFAFRPSAEEIWEFVTKDFIKNIMKGELDYLKQKRD